MAQTQNQQNERKGNGAAPVAPPANAQAQPVAAPVAEVQAAPAPVAAPVEAAEPDEHVNPYRRIFSGIVFSPATSDKEYPNERDGSTSKKLATAIVLFRGEFAGIPATVYGVRPKAGKAYAEVKFLGTMTANAIKPLDMQSSAQLSEFRRHLADEYIAWRSTQGKTTAPRVDAGVELDEF